jgi:hypothetical protein
VSRPSAIGAAKLHLDEFVIVQGSLRFGDDRRGEAMLPESATRG